MYIVYDCHYNYHSHYYHYHTHHNYHHDTTNPHHYSLPADNSADFFFAEFDLQEVVSAFLEL